MKTSQSLLVYLGGFILLTAMIVWNPEPLFFEMDILNFFQTIQTPELTTIFLAITGLADIETIVFIGCIFTGILLIQQKASQAISFVLSTLAGSGLVQMVKFLVDRARPNEMMQLTTAEFSSFPSGHTTTGIIVYSWILFSLTEHLTGKLRLSLRILGLIIVIIPIPISRMYLGVHWPLDILGGILLALSVLIVSRAATNHLREKLPNTRTDFDFQTQQDRIILSRKTISDND